MGVRKPEDAPQYLAEFALGKAAGIAGSKASEAIRHLDEEVKQEVLDAIPRLLSHLRSGKARKNGDKGALQRIMIVVQSIKERAKDVEKMAHDIQALQKLLNPDEIIGDITEFMTSIPEEAVNLKADDSLVNAGIKMAATLAPVAQVMEIARNASETIRQIKLLWNSNIDLASLLNFSVIQDAVIDELEDRLCALVSQAADIGAQKAEAFLAQELNPDDWIKAVKGES